MECEPSGLSHIIPERFDRKVYKDSFPVFELSEMWKLFRDGGKWTTQNRDDGDKYFNAISLDGYEFYYRSKEPQNFKLH
jgi:hypothetical protein